MILRTTAPRLQSDRREIVIPAAILLIAIPIRSNPVNGCDHNDARNWCLDAIVAAGHARIE
jgi:hypothetical protein